MSTLPHPTGTPTRAALERIFKRAFFDSGKGDRSIDQSAQIPEAAYEALPSPLRETVGVAPRRETRPILLAAALAVMSVCIPNVRGSYGGRWYAPPILVGLIAPPGSNKGLASFALKLVAPLDELLEAVSAQTLRDKGGVSQAPEGVKPHGLVLPADASSAGLLEAIARSEWPVITVETEIDSVVGHQGQDWRQLSPLLRKAAEHEPLSVIRKGYSLRIARPMVAALLSGTPDQFVRLIPSAQDGLFSRFWWVYTPPTDEWHSPRPQVGRVSPESELLALGDRVASLHGTLLAREAPVEFRLEDAHWDVFDAVGQGLKAQAREVGYGADVDSLVHRIGVVAFRLAMQLEALRRTDDLATMEDGDSPPSITATDASFELGLLLALVGLDHGLRLHGRLPAETDAHAHRNEDRLVFFDELPNQFSRAVAVEFGKEFGIATRTVDKYLRSFVESGIATKSRKGHYLKAGVEEVVGVRVGI